jgi:hypothetical protein
MSQDPDKKKEEEKKSDSSIKPEPETLHKTDPQDNMEGPVSSMMQGAKKTFDTNQSQEDADREKDENM